MRDAGGGPPLIRGTGREDLTELFQSSWRTLTMRPSRATPVVAREVRPARGGTPEQPSREPRAQGQDERRYPDWLRELSPRLCQPESEPSGLPAIVGPMAYSTTTVPTDAGDLPAHLWLPEAGRGPGIALFQEIFGISDYVRRRAQDLADLGYVVLAPEMFWRSGDVGPFGWDRIEQAIGKVAELDWPRAVLDGSAAVQHLRGLDVVNGATGIVGFCFGGGLGFNVAAQLESGGGEGVDALVSFYGSALPGLVDSLSVAAPSLHHFGLADQYIDRDEVRRLESVLTQQPRTTFFTYAGADHAFDNDEGPTHHPEASALAWQRTTEWLSQQVPVGSASP